MKKILIFVLLFFCASGLYAEGMGTTGGQFLKIGVGAKPMASGGAFGTISDDANALYFNPAGIGKVDGLEILTTGGLWFQNIYYGYLGVVKSMPGINSSIGFSALYLGVDDIPGYDDTGNPIDSHNAIDMGIGVTYALNLGDNLSLGITGKYINESLETFTATAFDMDIGLRFAMGSNMILGCAVQNLLQSEVKFISEGYPLARNIRAGIGYRLNTVMLGMDVTSGSDSGTDLRFGGEYVYNNIVFLRAGYNMPVGEDLDFFSGICAGGGLSFEKILFDYAFVPYGELGLTHRFSLTLKL